MAGQPEKARAALARSAERGREPAKERERLGARVDEALARAAPPPTVAAAPPPTPAPVAATPPPTLPPATLAPAPVAVPAAPPTAAPATPAPSPLRAQAERVPVPPRPTPVPSAAPASPAAPGAEPPVGAAAPPEGGEPRITSLLVVTEPGGATVYLDDEPIGITDPDTGRLVKTGLAAGAHRLRLARAGHSEVVQDVNVIPGTPATVRATLPALTRRTPGMALAAMGLVLALAAVGGLWMWRRHAASASEPGTRTMAPPTPASGRRPTAVGAPTLEPVEETAALTPPRTRVSAVGELFGEYRLIETLGKGGMATVFRAERRGEQYALKRPLAAYLEEPEFLERFLREAEIGRTLHHPNIIRIFERGEVTGVPYFTMELIDGETLSARVRRGGALAPKAAARVVAQVAEALDYAHLKGVVHRDLKPSNIMILGDGTVKVMDYGIARARRFEGLTVTGAFLGTPDYVAPETAEGKGTDARSDLYSLGVVFYEIVTGKKPFVGDTPFATLRKHCTEPPTPPSAVSPQVPRELEAIILRLLRKEPEDRYPGAEELLIELREYLNRAA